MDALVAPGEIGIFLDGKIYCRREHNHRSKQNLSNWFRFVSYITPGKLAQLKKKQNCTAKKIFSLELYIFLKQYQICFLLYLVANGPKTSLQQVMSLLHVSYISPTTGNRTALSKNNSIPAAFPCSQAQETLFLYAVQRELSIMNTSDQHIQGRLPKKRWNNQALILSTSLLLGEKNKLLF